MKTYKITITENNKIVKQYKLFLDDSAYQLLKESFRLVNNSKFMPKPQNVKFNIKRVLKDETINFSK